MLSTSARRLPAGSRRPQCLYVNPSPPGTVFLNFFRRLETSLGENASTGRQLLTLGKIEVSQWDGAQIREVGFNISDADIVRLSLARNNEPNGTLPVSAVKSEGSARHPGPG